MFTILSVLLVNSVDTGSVLETTSTFTITRSIAFHRIGFDQFSNSTKPMAGAVRPRLRGADGVCLSLLPPNSTCSTQARVWRNPVSAPAPTLPQPERPLHPAPSLLPCFFLTSSATTHPLATHIISTVLPAANLAIIERANKDRKLFLFHSWIASHSIALNEKIFWLQLYKARRILTEMKLFPNF